MRTILVWDAPTRLFKWLLVFFVGAAFLFSSMHPRGWLFVVHVGCGYAVVLLLLFRFAWGFIGGEHARFADFVRGWPAVRAQARVLLRLKPQNFVGHNPIGGWMILLMLATLALTVLTGLLSEGTTGGGGVLSTLLPPATIGAVGWIHGTLGFAIIWLAGFHVAGVLAESLLHRENLVRAMITGRKFGRDQATADARAVSPWRAAPLVLLLLLLGAWLAGGTRLAAPAQPRAEAGAARLSE